MPLIRGNPVGGVIALGGSAVIIHPRKDVLERDGYKPNLYPSVNPGKGKPTDEP